SAEERLDPPLLREADRLPPEGRLADSRLAFDDHRLGPAGHPVEERLDLEQLLLPAEKRRHGHGRTLTHAARYEKGARVVRRYVKSSRRSLRRARTRGTRGDHAC